MEPNKVVQALKVLHDEGREDLLREGVLEQAWVGLKRPKRLSAEGVSAAVVACTSPVKVLKKFKPKSVGGKKVARSPQSDVEPISVVRGPIEGVAGKRRGGSRFPRRQGASLSRRVAAGVGGGSRGCSARSWAHGGAGCFRACAISWKASVSPTAFRNRRRKRNQIVRGRSLRRRAQDGRHLGP
ncbi:hypothetical protein NDU88_006794 [Pleurodeles waltl]|uniref:Uncharacterized protein n=1 Tax=Pleurodeles waltl TaxID=8319 RepID=A0AAV7VMW5_PLEWA|nr:hypothetical protein NDU88_006794 [Pleurodeles waltl]